MHSVSKSLLHDSSMKDKNFLLDVLHILTDNSSQSKGCYHGHKCRTRRNTTNANNGPKTSGVDKCIL